MAGFSIIEALISIAVFGTLAAGMIVVLFGPLAAGGDAAERSRAVFLSEEGVEAARAIRNDRWANLAVGQHGLRKNPRWEFFGTEDVVVDGPVTFTRQVEVEAVRRNGGAIVPSGGATDPRTRKVVSRVSWNSPFGGTKTVQSQAYLTNWNVYDWRQSSDSDFNAGTHENTEVYGSGESAVVQLASSTGVKTWTSREGNLVVHSDEYAWNAGTYADTALSGTGSSAVVQEYGPARWIQMLAGKTFFQTTEQHFITGAFDNTVAVDTGDSGAVALNSTANWAAAASPVTGHLRAVAMVSSTDGWAVGDGGAILRWDGTAWTTFPSPTARQLLGVSMISATSGFAVGANSTVIRWNGTAWSSSPNLSGTLYGVKMVSATDGWIVGSSGKIYRWNGTAWTEFIDTGNQAWVSVAMPTASSGWAVASGGTFRRWNGTAWTAWAGYTSPSALASVSCSSISLCFAVGAQGQISRWDGTAWANFTSPTLNALQAVSMISDTDGWAVGAGGTVLRWNGTAWSSYLSPGATQMNGLVSISSSEAYAVGNGGTIWQYGSHYFGNGTYVSQAFDAGVSVTWGHIFWNEALPDGTDLTIAVRTGSTTNPGYPTDPNWSAWSIEYTDPYNLPIPSPTGRYLQYRATLTATNTFATPRLNSISIYYDEPSSGSFYDLKVTAPVDGWAVGAGGQMARFDGNNWQTYTPTPSASTLLDVDYTDASHVWAVGDAGTAIFWNGTTWATQATGTTRAILGVGVVSNTSVYAVGAHGLFLRSNGATWSVLTVPTIKDINAISMISDTDGWAVGSGGAIWRWNGTAWSAVASGTTASLNGVYAVDANNVFAVGQGGLTLYWNGSAWTSMLSDTSKQLNDIWCVAANDCWAWGVTQTFMHWDGVTWSATVFSSPSNPVIQGGYLVSATDGWAVGEGGAIYRYTASYPATASWTSPVVDSGAVGTRWNTVSWDSTEPMGTGVQIVTRTGPTAVPDGSWSAWSVAATDKGGSTVMSPQNQYLQYSALFSTTIGYFTATLQEVRLMHSAATGQDLYDIDGTAVADVWAVGRSGTIIHYDGTDWRPAVSPTSRSLRGISAVTSDVAFAVGDSGTFLRWDGTLWNTQPGPTAEDMNAVSMSSAAFGAAVGTSGAIAHWNGTAWVSVGTPTPDTLRGVHLYSDTFGFAVGDSGRIIGWDGANWTVAASPVTTRLNSVHLISATDGWAVGDGGVIIRWNGTVWTTTASPIVSRINAVEARSAGDVWAAGDYGVILRWDGSSWTSFTSPTTRNGYGITVYAPTDGWICGASGSLLKDPAPYAPSGTYLSGVLDTDAGPAYWDAVFVSAAVPTYATASIALRSGDTATPDGAWSSWTPEIAGPQGYIACMPARYLQYRLTLTTADTAQTPELQDITVTYHK